MNTRNLVIFWEKTHALFTVLIQNILNMRFFREILIGFSLAGFLFIGFHLMSWKNDEYNSSMTKILTEASDERQKAIYESFSGKKEKDIVDQAWQEVEMAFKEAANRSSGSPLNVYFKLLEADSHVWMGNIDKAIELTERTLSTISKSYPFYYMYKTKCALMKLDSEKEDIQRSGVEELQNLAFDKENKCFDYALFSLGQYYKSIGNIDEAKQVWNDLIRFSRAQEHDAASPWAAMAEENLKLTL